MTYIVFDKDISIESIKNLIYEIVEKNDDTIIYFESSGGELNSAEYFIDFTFRYDKKITLISAWQLSSSAFDIFMFSKTYKVIKAGCFGVAHLCRREISTIDLKKPTDENSLLMNDIEECNEERGRKYKTIGFNKRELSKYESGEDVVFNAERMRDISKKAEYIVFGANI